MASGEAILGFPAEELSEIVRHLTYLDKKALPPHAASKVMHL